MNKMIQAAVAAAAMYCGTALSDHLEFPESDFRLYALYNCKNQLVQLAVITKDHDGTMFPPPMLETLRAWLKDNYGKNWRETVEWEKDFRLIKKC